VTVKQKGYLSALIAVFIWSGFILVSRMGGMSELSQYDVIAIRYATCAAMLLPIWWFKYRFCIFKIKLFIASLVGGLAYALCTFRGFQLSTASHAALFLPGLMPLFIILLSVVVNREVQAKSKYLGVGIITLGVGFMFIDTLSDAQGVSYKILQGDGWFIAGSLCWALFSVLIKRWEISPWEVTVSLAFFTCVLYLPVYILWLPKALSSASLTDIALQAVYQGLLATIIQMIFYVKAVQAIGPSSMGVMMAIVPLVSGVSAIFVFDEAATPTLLLGLLSVSVGAWVAHSHFFKMKFSISNQLKNVKS